MATVELQIHLGMEVDTKGHLASDKKKIKKLIEKSEPCSIDWKKTHEPQMGVVEEFNGTFASSNHKETAVVGRLYCACGEYGWGDEVTLKDMTIGQLIWHVVKAGEIEG